MRSMRARRQLLYRQLDFPPIHPFFHARRLPEAELFEQCGWLRVGHDDVAMLGPQEPLLDGVIEKTSEMIVEASDVAQAAGFRVNAELIPGEDFAALLV